MKPLPFRLKIALLAGAITTALLVGAGLLLWELTARFSLDRVDRELRNIGQQNLQRTVGRDHWARLERALEFVSGGADSPPYALHVREGERVVFQSANWPRELDPVAFPEPTDYGAGPGPAEVEPRRAPRGGQNEAPPRGEPPLPRKFPRFYTSTADHRTWRIAVMGNPYTTLLLAADIDTFNADMLRLRNLFLAALPGVLLVAAGGSWFLAGRALRPVAALTELAGGITAQGLDKRIAFPVRDADFARLVEVFNSMLGRLERSFQQAVRFSADASHELRTPLARLQAELEQALRDAAPGSSAQAAIVSQLEEVHRLTDLVDKLLLLSRADAGRLELSRQATDLAQLLAGVAEDCQVQAAATGLAVEVSSVPDVWIQADPVLLEQALQNLAGNALKYNRPQGRIRFELSCADAIASVRVSNTGPGIGSADRERLFQRFHRIDPSRGAIAGTGLGLSLAREITRAHGGELVLEPADGEWTTFRLTLPLAPRGD